MNSLDTALLKGSTSIDERICLLPEYRMRWRKCEVAGDVVARAAYPRLKGIFMAALHFLYPL